MCNHPAIKSVNCVLYCAVCGALLPADALGREIPAQHENAPEPPKKARKTQKQENR